MMKFGIMLVKVNLTQKNLVSQYLINMLQSHTVKTPVTSCPYGIESTHGWNLMWRKNVLHVTVADVTRVSSGPSPSGSKQKD